MIFSVPRGMAEIKYVQITEDPRLLWSEFLRNDVSCQITEVCSELYKL
jgi:hypothetical protein